MTNTDKSTLPTTIYFDPETEVVYGGVLTPNGLAVYKMIDHVWTPLVLVSPVFGDVPPPTDMETDPVVLENLDRAFIATTALKLTALAEISGELKDGIAKYEASVHQAITELAPSPLRAIEEAIEAALAGVEREVAEIEDELDQL